MNDLVPVVVEKVVIDENIGGPFVLLKDKNGEVYLPISIGYAEAQSIFFAIEGVNVPRPITHDLIVNLLKAFDAQLDRVVVNDLKNNTFYARIVMRKDNVLYSIDARPSDSIAIALRTGASIFVSKKVMDEAGQYNLI